MLVTDEMIDEIETLMGGPRDWPKGINPPAEDSEDVLVDVWNAAIDAVIKKLKEI